MNAFCLPGGKVAFYTGILPVLENEAAMAIVMGHEAAHAVARHGAQRMSQALVTQGVLIGADIAILKDSKYRGLALGALGLGAQVGVMLPFSRSHESQSDEMGLA
jgi:Zn-dependent protease with chaperone function